MSSVNGYSIVSDEKSYFQNELCSQSWPRSSTKSYCKLECDGGPKHDDTVTSSYVSLVNGRWNSELGGLSLTYPKGLPQTSAPSTQTLVGHVGPYKYPYQGNYECPLWSSATDTAGYSYWMWVPAADETEANPECSDCYFPFFQGGKLPGGLCAGGPMGGGCYTGEDTKHLACELGETCAGITEDLDGSTLRLMWRREGRIAAYLAKMNPYCERDDDGNWHQPDQYVFVESGDINGTWHRTGGKADPSDFPGATGVLKAGAWNYLESGFALNSCGSDGCAHDGHLYIKHTSAAVPSDAAAKSAELVLERSDIHWRCHATTSIDSFYFQTFMGGSSSDWAPTVDTEFTFRNFTVWREAGGSAAAQFV